MSDPTTISRDRFRLLVLESADDCGIVAFPILRDEVARLGWILGMHGEGLIERRGPGPADSRRGPWYITPKGQALAPAEPAGPGPSAGPRACTAAIR